MRFETLDAWLAWQETLNPRGIELGLDRVRQVLDRMQLRKPPYRVVTIGGTNGKGSVAAYCDAILRAGGFDTGRYLSPHILKYNERIAVNGVDIDDASLCDAFERVDRARDELPLTYFEFGTLAALDIFRTHGVDVAVLEVGLGGRLDAVNAVDPDVAAVVSVGLDHMDWLGDSIDAIAREKAGIFRRDRPAIFGAGPAPDALVATADGIGAHLQVGGRDYRWHEDADGWTWSDSTRTVAGLPIPAMHGMHQFSNAATAVAGALALEPGLDDVALRHGISRARIPGRLQRVADAPEILVDVGHNAAAAAIVAAFLDFERKTTRAVLAMLADKDAAAFVAEFGDRIRHWHLAGLDGERGRTAAELRQATGLPGSRTTEHATVADALAAALEAAPADERILVMGSFHTVGEAAASGLYSVDGSADGGDSP